jgi:hypothetical protein
MKFVDYNHDGKINGDDQIRLDKSNVPTFNLRNHFDLRYNHLT